MNEPQKSKTKYKWSLLLFLLLLGVTFFWIFRKFPLSDLLRSMDGLRIEFLLIGVVLIVSYVVWEGISVRVILRSIGHPISVLRGFIYSATDLYYSGITPSATGGQPVMLYYMAKDDIPIAKSGITTLFNLIAYKAVLLIAGVFSILFKFDWICEHGEWWWWLLIAIGFVVTLVLLLVCLLSVFSSSLVRVIGTKGICLLAKLHLLKHPEERIAVLEHELEDYAAAAEILRQDKTLFWKVLGCNFMQRLSFFSVTYCVYLAFGLHGLSYLDLLATQVLCALAVDTLPFPGGVGMAEFMTQQLYSGIYSAETQVPAMLLTRGINFYLCMILCAGTTFINHIRVWFHQRGQEETKV